VTTDQLWRRPGVRALAIGVGVLVLVHVLAFLALLALQREQGDTVLAGVHVDGDPVAGATRDELRATVDAAAERRKGHAVVVVAGEEEEVRTDRDSLGATANVDRTVERAWARGRRGLWRAVWDRLQARRGARVDLSVELDRDRDRLDAWAQEAAAELSRPPRDAGLTYVVEDDEGDEVLVEVAEPREGHEVDPDDLVDEVEEALDEPGEVRIDAPSEVEEPTITAADLDAVRVEAERVVTAPVVLRNPSAGDDLGLSRVDLARYVTVTSDPEAAEGERLRIRFDEDRLRSYLDDGGREAIEAEPVDAEFSIDGDSIEIVGGTPGFELDTDALPDRILDVAVQEEGTGDEPREGELAGSTTDPEVSSDELEELGIEEEVSSFSTDLVPGESRNQNIHLGADLLDGAMIAPGDTFSLNDRLGPRTRERGFVENGYIDADGELTEVVGGGSSQLGTTFFNAAWFAGIELLDFKPHSLYFTRYPMGREATLSYGTIDVVVENDSPHHILVATDHSESHVTVRFFSTAWAEVDTWTGEPYDRVEAAERDGFTVEFGRTITYPDGSTRSEEHVHRYDPED
jgi:vancomycin resistance protein YoaR